ncbi:UNVERIFIED_CONTAM: hypothetical protein GTU68_020048, partial [Idotea baltica]|nr:hypothetical protein [Idotea baltica]
LKRKRSPEARSAINATGVLLHTNLGRAPIAGYAIDMLASTAGYGVVQIKLEDNSRSKRDEEISSLLSVLTGCESATVVNNNAAATFMLLNSLAAGAEVIISRGQLVEIGGSFRMTDVMDQSGALLKEVGTTNRTHLYDYERAISENTGALIYVEPSNYEVIGFSCFPSLAELCELGKKHNIPVIADLGSGALVPTEKYGIKHSLTIAEALSAGAAITCSSGDKLIGGPQAGIICGSAELVARVRKSPFARMFRVDKLTLTGIESTLQEFVNGSFEKTIPFYQMLSVSVDDLEIRAKQLSDALIQNGLQVKIESTNAFVGGGTLPAERIASFAVVLESKVVKVESLARALRLNIPPIFCRIENNALYFDMRTLLKGHLELLIEHIPLVCQGIEK